MVRLYCLVEKRSRRIRKAWGVSSFRTACKALSQVEIWTTSAKKRKVKIFITASLVREVSLDSWLLWGSPFGLFRMPCRRYHFAVGIWEKGKGRRQGCDRKDKVMVQE